MSAHLKPDSERIDLQAGLVVEVTRILAELSGLEASELAADATFLNLGFDSLFLTQVSASLKTRFDLRVSFRQLMEQTPSIDSLAGFLLSELDVDTVRALAVPETAAAPQARGAVIGQVGILPAATDPSVTMSELTRRQIELLSNQIDALCELSGLSRPSIDPVLKADAPARDEPVRRQDVPGSRQGGPWKPINKERYDAHSPASTAALESLVQEYNDKTGQSKRYAQMHRSHHADPRGILAFNTRWKDVIYPLISQRSSGSRMWDIDGNEYLDVQSGFGSVLLGHNPPVIRDALKLQLEDGMQIGPQAVCSGTVAGKICELTGNERATFCNTGSEAVLAALRVARTVTGKDKVVMFAGDYHGLFDEMVARRVGDMRSMKCYPYAPGIPTNAVQNVVMLDYGDPACFEVLDDIKDDLAAVLIEPVQSRRPDHQPVEFLRRLRDWTLDQSVAYIFDEVITGFRIHPRGAQGFYGIQADLCCYGKIIGGGMPVGVLAGKREYMDALDGGQWQFGDDSVPEVGVTYFAGTFVRHPLALAAADATADTLLAGGTELFDELHALSESFVGEINERLHVMQSPIHIQHCRSMMFIEFLVESPFNALFFIRLRLNGIHVMETGTLFLTLAHTEADVRLLVERFAEAAEWLIRNEFHPLFDGEAAREQLSRGSLDAATEAADSAQQPDDVILPTLTAAQREIWLAIQQNENASLAYNQSLSLDFTGELHVDRLEAAIASVVNLHESLRLVISSAGELRVGPKVPDWALEVLDLSDHPSPRQAEAIEAALLSDANTVFDLVNGPVVRFLLIRLGQTHCRLSVTLHHIAGDGASFAILLQHLADFYNGTALDASDIMQLEQYRDWLSAPDQQALRAEDRRFWVSVHEDPCPPLELPVDRPRPAQRSFAAGTAVREADVGVVCRLEAASRSAGVTPYQFLLGVFQALINRVSGQTDFNVAIPVAGQLLTTNPKLLCHCVSLVCLRSRLQIDQPFEAVLKNARSGVLDAYDHAFCNYGELVEALDQSFDASRNPLFSVMFNVDFVQSGVEFSGLDVTVGRNPKLFEFSDLFLDVGVDGARLALNCSFNSDVHDASSVQRWLEMYLELLELAIENPQQRLSLMNGLTDADRSALQRVNRTGREYPRESTFTQQFATQAVRSSNTQAVMGPDDRALGYAELDRESNRLAQYLASRAVGPGDRVGVYLERSVEMVVALLGVLKSGAAYVPLDPLFPAERLSYMASDAGLKTVLTQHSLLATVPGGEGERVVLDAPEVTWRKSDDESIDRSTAEGVAYVIYTSGSTGQPKGVAVSHRALLNFLCSMQVEPGLQASDRLLAVTTLSFDIAGLELYLPLLAGASVVLASREESMDPQRLSDRLVSSAATVMQATPATWKLLVEHGWKGDDGLKVLCGGEPLSRDLADRLLERSAEAWNLYGPTETTIWSTVSRLQPGDASITVGHPIGNTQVYVLDASMNLQPLGVSGELYIGGDGLADGYLHQPALTAERFVADPFSECEGARLYRSGDRARWRAEGELEVLGRLDDQVKLRGYRVEPGEIRARLVALQTVKDAVVVVREDQAEDAQLVAYLVAHDEDAALDIDALRSALKQTLPEYMIPSLWVQLGSVPLTPNGKVDIRGLPAPDADSQRSSRPYVAPGTPTEQLLADIWSELLGVEQVSRHDGFFELGGHSLKAVQVISRLRPVLSIEPPLRWLFEYPTVALLATAIDAQISPGDVAPPLELGDGLIELEL